ncbi:hypothetical protein SELMODRAFT_183226 [Selaginella moellendorffii]|uniref:DJ-1/PfpI domain-containing protein n=1 Tax=Selaginella moellendorffii TaxID=88036 RepID=D8SW04_SELML|nr:glutathione-independent glyoxalase HSP31 [Selaginella moellendorffii]XP_002992837.1 glutathione-independent glyoxalase HSP31 [Selaginella moellendorffii]EFJ06127.1 hypothetical protein SELMODRAFT_162626 [Selaginella moellendorffii]EFJ11408.1 hypothetical protein SELMODRAFT_183226 [Selaginella moellendorffii]|eukprot:XP_002987572.1 glutathione-independent glyoxalase HSP31 [Selaginella moellendorffii]
MAEKRVLFVCTSCDRFKAVDEKTGLWAEELAAPYYEFIEQGAKCDVASIKGGAIPLDPNSLAENYTTDHVKRFHQNEHGLKDKLEKSIAIKDAADTYDAIFLPGGHGVCFDFAENAELIALVEKFWADGKIVAAVCHGPVGLCGPLTPDGDPIVKGKKVTGFSNSEEAAVGKTDKVPYLLEDKLKKLGGRYESGSDWTPYAVADGRLITGQNPQSSLKTAQLVVEAFQNCRLSY